MELNQLYKSILSMASMVADDEGFVSDDLGDEKVPTTIKGKRLVLPQANQLHDLNLEHRVVFHPLVESVSRGESDVLACFRERLNLALNTRIGLITYQLLVLAISVDKHKFLKPEQTLFMSKVKDADEGTIEILKTLLAKATASDASMAFVHLFVKKSLVVGGRKYPRAGVVSFPFYEELIKPRVAKTPNKIFNVQVSKNDREALTGLLEYLLPNIDKPDAYLRTSSSDVAPSLDALLRSALAVADALNDVLELFKDQIEDAESLKFNSDWEDTFNDLGSIMPQVRMIPMQRGNEGALSANDPTRQSSNALSTTEKPVHQAASSPAQLYANAAPQPVQAPQSQALAPVNTAQGPMVQIGVDMRGQPLYGPAPVQQPLQHQPQAPSDNRPVSVAELMAQRQQMQQPQQQYMTQYGGYGQPAAVQPPPPPIETANGVNFRSLMASDPRLQAAVGVTQYGGFGAMQVAPPAPRVPGWAQPPGFSGGYGSGNI